MLTADLWDSVARIADGFKPDEHDRAVLRLAGRALRWQAEVITFVDGHGVGDALVDIVWRAATQVDLRGVLGEGPVCGLGVLAAALDRIADGDRAVAQVYVPLVERMSRLAEQAASTEAGGVRG